MSLRIEAAEQKEARIPPPSTTVSTIFSPRTKYLKDPSTLTPHHAHAHRHSYTAPLRNSTTDSAHWQLSQRAVRNGRVRRRPAQAGYTSNDVKVRRRKNLLALFSAEGVRSFEGVHKSFCGVYHSSGTKTRSFAQISFAPVVLVFLSACRCCFQDEVSRTCLNVKVDEGSYQCGNRVASWAQPRKRSKSYAAFFRNSGPRKKEFSDY